MSDDFIDCQHAYLQGLVRDRDKTIRGLNARIAVLEKQLGEADAALIAAERGYTENGDDEVYEVAIEAARTRKGDPRG